jgi:beta-lactamase class A
VTGLRGKHSARASSTATALKRSVFGVLGAVAVVVIVVAVVASYMAVQGSGSPVSAPTAAGQPGGTPAGQLKGASSAPITSPSITSPPVAAATAKTSRSPAPAAAPGHGDPFGSAATGYLAGRTGTVLAAVYDVKTGQTWRFGQGRPQAEASVVKLDVLETLLAERAGSTSLAASDRSLAQAMIEDSDNTAATSLWYEVGGGTRIRSFNTQAGLAQTAPSSCVVCPGFSWPGWGLSTTTPADQLALLKELIRPSPLISDAARDYALSLLENVTADQRWGVSGGVPAQVTVALKNGWLPLEGTNSDWQINSVGWLSGDGRNYLMAVLTTGNPTEQYGIDTIDQLAAMVWQHMK